jgi:hypothetical protein
MRSFFGDKDGAFNLLKTGASSERALLSKEQRTHVRRLKPEARKSGAAHKLANQYVTSSIERV